MSFIIENGVLEEYIPPETDIVIPDGVTSIGYRAFFECTNLRTIEISDGVTSIGEQAFSHCHNLRSIFIPSSVASIGKSAFFDCYFLRSIQIPDNVTHIGQAALSNVKIILCSSNFQLSFYLHNMWGIDNDERNLALFYNYPSTDNFKKIKQTCYKYPMSLLRFFVNNEYEYQDYIKSHIIEIASGLIYENNYELINKILVEGFVAKNNIDNLINYAVEKKKTEITALLLDYKNKHFGFTDINKRFRL